MTDRFPLVSPTAVEPVVEYIQITGSVQHTVSIFIDYKQ